MTAPEHVHPRQRTVGVIHPEAFDDAMIAVDHIYVPDGSFTCDDCGRPGHDPGMVGLLVDMDAADEDAPSAAVELTAAEALLLADRLTRAAHLILESAEDRPDVEREAARLSGHVPGGGETDSSAKVWAAWNAVPEGEESPVKLVARQLGMEARDVAAIVYPPDEFGWWSDAQEPDLPEAGPAS